MMHKSNNLIFRRSLILTVAFVALFAGRHAFAAVQLPDGLRGVTPLACGEIITTGTYTLSGNISTSTGPCFTITSGGSADQTVIDGVGTWTINGSVFGDGTGTSGNPGHNFTLQNIIVTGTTSSVGGFHSGFTTGGTGGTIIIATSTVATTTVNGGNSGFSGGSAGSITIASSTVSAAIANGGVGNAGSFGNGGLGGSVVVQNNSTVNLIKTNGSDCPVSSCNGGDGGSVTVSTSTVSSIQSNGGAPGSGSGTGGNGGGITITRTSLNLSNDVIFTLAGNGGTNGTLAFNYATFSHSNLLLSALSDLVLNGPGGSPGDLGAYGGGILGAIPGDTINDISQCNLGLAGTYTLGADLTGTCSIFANGVILDGATHKITGNIVGDSAATGTAGYDFTIKNITVTGTTSSNGGNGASGGAIIIATSTVNAVMANGGDYTLDVGGNGGSISVSSSTIVSVTANGGSGGPFTGGSNGGSITINGPNLVLSGATINALGGPGNSGRGINGTVILNYSTLTDVNLIFSALSDITLNGPGSPGDLGAYGGGIFGTFPGAHLTAISQCNLGFPGTYILDNDLTGNCVITASSSVILNGNGHKITGNVIGDGLIRGDWGRSYTLQNLTVTGTSSANGADYNNDLGAGTGAGGIITVVKSNIVLANEHFSVTGGNGVYGRTGAGGLVLNYSTIDLTNGTFPDVYGYLNPSSGVLIGLTLNGPGNLPGKLGPMLGGSFSNPGDTITDISKCHMLQPGTYTLGANLAGNCYIKSNGVILDGAGHSLTAAPTVLGQAPTGAIIGQGYVGNGYNFTLQNIITAGGIVATGISSGYGGNDGDGGRISILNSTTTGANIYLTGKNYGGALTIMSSSSSLTLSGLTVNVSSTVTGGDVTITGTGVDLSSANISGTGGTTNGTLTVNYNTLTDSGITLSALSDIKLNGPGGLPGDIGSFAGGTLGALPGDTLTDISQCVSLSLPGTYTLGSDLTGNCTITGNGVIINGAGHTIHGGVSGNGPVMRASGYDFTLENITVTGTTSSNGFVTNVFPSYSTGDYNGGHITISSSTVATTTANGGAVGFGELFGSIGGNGGSITLSSSTATLVETNGGGFSISDLAQVFSSDVIKMSAQSVYGSDYQWWLTSGKGGNGGTIAVSTSTAAAVVSNGGNVLFGLGGNGGSIQINNSLANPANSAVGANGGGIVYCGYGGNGGSVVLNSSNYGTSTVSFDKGNDVTTSILNGGYCPNTSSPISFAGSSSSGSSGYFVMSGTYTPSSALQAPQAPEATENRTTVVPTAVPSSPSSSGGSSGTQVSVPNASDDGSSAGGATGGVIESIRSFGTAAAKAVADTAVAVANAPASKTVQTTSFLAGLLASVAAFASAGLATPWTASELVLAPVKLWGLAMAGFGMRKRSLPWGTVYDSVTKQPIDPAFVTARDASGRVVAESITDLDGRWGFLLPDGTYYISVKKTNYEFPSRKMQGRQSDELYSNLYFGEPVTVKGGEVLDKNIPMDQKNFDWNEYTKGKSHFMFFHTKHEKIWAVAGNYIYGIGLTVSAISAALKPSAYNLAILGIFVLAVVFLEFGVKYRKLGSVVDKATGKPMSYAIVRVTTPDRLVTLRSGVCDASGRYYCIVPKGEYRVSIERKNDDGGYAPVYESPVISGTSGIVNTNFAV